VHCKGDDGSGGLCWDGKEINENAKEAALEINKAGKAEAETTMEKLKEKGQEAWDTTREAFFKMTGQKEADTKVDEYRGDPIHSKPEQFATELQNQKAKLEHHMKSSDLAKSR
jgi:hypothetical protein